MAESSDSDSLSPLPPVLSQGLVAATVFGFMSFVFSTALFLFLTYRFMLWRRNSSPRASMNQFLILIYNLVVADIQQSIAFMLNLNSLRRNALEVGNATCWAQGWFVTTGDLASSVFILAIAVHTFLAVVKGRELPNHLFYGAIVFLWMFVHALGIIAVAMHPTDLFVRAGAWCWINADYQPERLWLHYFWIFVAMSGTIIIYGTIYITLRTRSSSPTTPTPHGATPLMILYPAIYTICTAPLAGGRIASMAGRDIDLAYFCAAGSMIACNGWLDTLLYSFTRRGIVFAESPPTGTLGIETFWGLEKLGGFGTTTTIEAGGASDPTKTAAGREPKKLRRGGGRTASSDSTENLYVMRRIGTGTGDKGGSDAVMEIKAETTVRVQREVDKTGCARRHAEEQMRQQLQQQQAAESQDRVDKASWETKSGRSFDDS